MPPEACSAKSLPAAHLQPHSFCVCAEVGGDNPALADYVILPCMRMLEAQIQPGEGATQSAQPAATTQVL